MAKGETKKQGKFWIYIEDGRRKTSMVECLWVQATNFLIDEQGVALMVYRKLKLKSMLRLAYWIRGRHKNCRVLSN